VAKLPHPPPAATLAAVGPDLVAVARHTVLWRMHHTSGPHVLAWNAMRAYGPVATARFDPHPPPPGAGSGERVLYVGLDVQTCLAEVFQRTRVVNRRRGAPYVTGFSLTRTARLLDLSGSWPTRAGASQALNSGRTDVSRMWARAIRTAFPKIDGVWYPSSMNGNQPCVALFGPAADALPAAPKLSLPLSHPGLTTALARAATAVGYAFL
jgi:hypothetical protein